MKYIKCKKSSRFVKDYLTFKLKTVTKKNYNKILTRNSFWCQNIIFILRQILNDR